MLIHLGCDLSRNFQLDFEGINGLLTARHADGPALYFLYNNPAALVLP